MQIAIIIATILISAVVFIPVGVAFRKRVAESKIDGAETEAKKILELANKEAENIKKEEIFKAKEQIMQERQELEQEIRQRRGEVQKQESRIIQKEENLDRKEESLERKERDFDKRYKEMDEKEEELNNLIQKELEELFEDSYAKHYRIRGTGYNLKVYKELSLDISYLEEIRSICI